MRFLFQAIASGLEPLDTASTLDHEAVGRTRELRHHGRDLCILDPSHPVMSRRAWTRMA